MDDVREGFKFGHGRHGYGLMSTVARSGAGVSSAVRWFVPYCRWGSGSRSHLGDLADGTGTNGQDATTHLPVPGVRPLLRSCFAAMNSDAR